jgi:ABC-type branched-subunit amino acid transport system substrate-binding protein
MGKLHYPRTTYLDFADKKTLDWVEQYKKKFKSDPTDYSAIGYDVMMYYGRGLNQYGKLFPNHFSEIKSDDLVGNIFDYFKTGAESGFENRHVYILGTSDFEIIKEN